MPKNTFLFVNHSEANIAHFSKTFEIRDFLSCLCNFLKVNLINLKFFGRLRAFDKLN